MFGFLDGLSFWWWLIVALALGAVEMLVFSTVLLWPALAAGLVGLWLAVAPATRGDWQVALFAGATLALGLLGRELALRWRKARADPEPGLNNRATRLVGREGVMSGPGQATVDGDVWPARPEGAGLAQGARIIVRAVENGALVVTAAPDRGPRAI